MAQNDGEPADLLTQSLLAQPTIGEGAGTGLEPVGSSIAAADIGFSAAKWRLQGSYAMAAWAWRSWEFAVALLLIELYPYTLRMVSMYGLMDNAVRIVFGSRVGAYISRHDLVRSATAMYLLQNACICVSSLCALILLFVEHPSDLFNASPWFRITLLVLMIGLGALSSVGSSGVRIAVEVQAVAALGAGSPARLSRLNAGFRAIDLTCLLAAPMLVGVIMTWMGTAAATLLLGAYTLLAWMPELLLLRAAFKASPVLQASREPKPVLPVSQEPRAGSVVEPNGDNSTYRAKPGFLTNLHVYYQQPVLLPNLAMGFLYCTVLSLGFLMTSYCQWSGMTGAEVSAFRGMGALTGLAATVLTPPLMAWLGTVTTGWLGGAYQLLCLTLGSLPVLITAGAQYFAGDDLAQPSAGLVRAMIVGVALSRTGLWTYDLSLTQLVQTMVPKSQLGIVSGLQTSLQACFETLSFVAGLVFHDPRQFPVLVLFSLGMVTTAFTLYSTFALRQQCGGRARTSSSGGLSST